MDRRRFLAAGLLGGLATLAAACGRAISGGTSTTVASAPPRATTTTEPASTSASATTRAAQPSTTGVRVTPTTASPTVLEVINRTGWGAAEPTGGFSEHTIERLTIHHTARRLDANRNAPKAILSHQRFHQLDRGWSDIAYHFLVDAEGNIYEGRPVDAVGDTGTNYDPAGHFLVSAEANFDEQPVPAAQLDAMVWLLAWAAREHGLGRDPLIAGHRDVASTTCPGDNLYALIADGSIARTVGERVAEPIELVILDDDESTARVAAIEA